MYNIDMQKYRSWREAREKLQNLYQKLTLDDAMRFNSVINSFNNSFPEMPKDGCYMASSSGRIEIVGNHTDHNGGKVLASTIDRDILAGFLPRNDNKVVLKTKGFYDIVFDLKDIKNREANSRGMVKGVLFGLLQRGYKIGGFNAYLNSNVKSGAGMSSSAAFQLLVGQIQNHLYNDGKILPTVLAEIGQFAENEYFNKPCGLLDQSVIAIGGTILLNFEKELKFQQIENNCEGLSFVVIDTGGSHGKLTNHYADIPKEMKAVAKYFGKSRLIDVDENLFFESFEKIDATERAKLRAKHFFEENKIVMLAIDALESGNSVEFLRCVNQSGESSLNQLQNCYFETDTTIKDAIETVKGFLKGGAVRVHGGGFAGTILCVVEKENLVEFLKTAKSKFGSENVHSSKLRKSGCLVL